MTHKTKIWQSVQFSYGAVIVVSAVLLLSLAQYSRVTIDRQNKLIYADRKTQKIAAFNEIIRLRSDSLESFVNENTYWDDMVSFVNTPTQQFKDDNIILPMTVHELDGTWTYNAAGQPSSSATFLPAQHGSVSLGLSAADLKKMFSKSYHTHYYQNSPAGLLEIFGSTVQATDDPDRKQTPSGYYFVSRKVDEKVLKEIAASTQNTIKLVPHSVPVKSELTQHQKQSTLTTFAVDLKRYDGTTSAQYQVTYSASALTDIVNLANRELTINIVGYVVISVILILAFGRIIGMPLVAIQHTLETEDPNHLKSLDGSRSEFGRLATLITDSFEQRAELKATVTEMSATQKDLEHRTQELEKTNRLMLNRELRMIELKKQAAELKSELSKQQGKPL